MWLTLYALLLIFAWYQSFFWSPVHLYVLFSVLYLLVYVLRAEDREWHWFRSWAFWDRFRKWYFPHHVHSLYWNEMTAALDAGCSLVFLVVNPTSLVDTVSAFGLHGQKNPVLSRLSPLIVAPWYLFYVPYVTDLIQWTGLVPDGTRHKEFTEIVNDIAVEAGVGWRRHIVIGYDYRPGGELEESNLQELKWAAEQTRKCGGGGGVEDGRAPICLVPVIHTGSFRLYRRLMCRSTPRAVWPFCGFGYFGSCLPRRTELHTFVGKPIRAQNDCKPFADAFFQELRCLSTAANSNLHLNDDGDDNNDNEDVSWDIERGL